MGSTDSLGLWGMECVYVCVCVYSSLLVHVQYMQIIMYMYMSFTPGEKPINYYKPTLTPQELTWSLTPNCSTCLTTSSPSPSHRKWAEPTLVRRWERRGSLRWSGTWGTASTNTRSISATTSSMVVGVVWGCGL